MNASTISKVQFFRHAVELALKRKLRTAGKTLAYRVDWLLESRGARMWALVGTTLGIVLGIYTAIILFRTYWAVS